jgi:hypothetical protein
MKQACDIFCFAGDSELNNWRSPPLMRSIAHTECVSKKKKHEKMPSVKN